MRGGAHHRAFRPWIRGVPELAQQIAEAEIVTTAVGLTILPRIAGAIAAGIEARREQGVEQPLNVIACENGVRATSQLKAAC